MLVMILITRSHLFLSYNYLHKQGDCYCMLHSIEGFSLIYNDNWTNNCGASAAGPLKDVLAIGKVQTAAHLNKKNYFNINRAQPLLERYAL